MRASAATACCCVGELHTWAFWLCGRPTGQGSSALCHKLWLVWSVLREAVKRAACVHHVLSTTQASLTAYQHSKMQALRSPQSTRPQAPAARQPPCRTAARAPVVVVRQPARPCGLVARAQADEHPEAVPALAEALVSSTSTETTSPAPAASAESPEIVFYEGSGAKAELALSLALLPTLIWAPLSIASIGRHLWITVRCLCGSGGGEGGGAGHAGLWWCATCTHHACKGDPLRPAPLGFRGLHVHHMRLHSKPQKCITSRPGAFPLPPPLPTLAATSPPLSGRAALGAGHFPCPTLLPAPTPPVLPSYGSRTSAWWCSTRPRFSNARSTSPTRPSRRSAQRPGRSACGVTW